MKSILTSIILVLLVTSCGMIEINESGYRSISHLEGHHIKPFELAESSGSCRDLGCLSVYEITSQNILDSLSNHEYSWIHTWLPFCAIEKCVNIYQFENLENNYKSYGLNMTFISRTYDINKIITRAKQSNFSKTIYVLDGSYFGYKNKKVAKKLYKDLNTNSKEDDYFFYSDYLFKGDSLIYMGNEINDSIIDNLLKSKQLLIPNKK